VIMMALVRRYSST